ncbi:MAG: hypothetical protein L0H29_10855, partial [Sinobacteraceae bacterium]|nr:hypothetical protein [Nevskiaceae bacterium]
YAATYAVPWRGSMGGTMSGASHDTTSHLYAGQQISPSTDPAQQTHRGSDIYGPTTRGQTLTRVSAIISSNTGIPAGKVAVSLYEGNRRKFTDEDPKRLKAGVLLKVPDVVQMTLTQPAQARALKDYLAGMAPNPYLVSPTHEATYQKSTVATWFNGWFTLATAKAVVARTQTLLAKRWKLALLLCLLLATVVTFRGRWAALRQGRKAKQHAQAKVAQIQAEHRRREAEAQRQRDNRAARQRTLQATGPEAIRHQHIERLKRRLADNPHEVSDMLWLARDYLADGNTEGYAHMARLIEAEGTPAQCRRLRALKAG